MANEPRRISRDNAIPIRKAFGYYAPRSNYGSRPKLHAWKHYDPHTEPTAVPNSNRACGHMACKVSWVMVRTDKTHSRSKLTAFSDHDAVTALDITPRHVARVASLANAYLIDSHYPRGKVNRPRHTSIDSDDFLPEHVANMIFNCQIGRCIEETSNGSLNEVHRAISCTRQSGLSRGKNR